MSAPAKGPLRAEISQHIWDTRYRYRASNGGEARIEDSWRRVAGALSRAEPTDADVWAERFYLLLEGFGFMPGGRILAGAGTGLKVSLLNCFVMGVIPDSMEGIFDALKEGALTLQQGGGIGYDFSTLRPRGSRAKASGTVASGPVTFMAIWDAMCATLLSTGARRGAMMATLRCDHPDIEEFVGAKRVPGQLSRFNLSVQVSDAFMGAVREGGSWPLVFPAGKLEHGTGETVLRRWTGEEREVPCRVVRRVDARGLWDLIMRSTYQYAEPGVLFVDRINQQNNLWYREHLTATNPCGEEPLPPYGACDLGSLNLTAFVREPFTRKARLDTEALAGAAMVATRMLDDVLDVSRWPLPAQERQAKSARRVGLGMTGLGDALFMLGLHYGSEPARALAALSMRTVCHAAYRASIELARHKGAFPAFDRAKHLEAPFIQSLPAELREGIATHGIRNSHLTAIAPAGTISLLANNVSSGIEPVFELRHRRRVLEPDRSVSEYVLVDPAYALWREQAGSDAPLPTHFVSARQLPPEAHLLMQAAVQPFVDSAISKTINVPEDQEFEAFRGLYERAFELGLKGCTTFRPNPVTGAVLTETALPGPHCCAVERETD
ncbi:MAG: adenosylcobalamin-dependent ribonucleoside-diphosphate reductase [Myxococcaceae bacterium]